MEVDEDLDAGLLRQFNCLGTTDKEVLIKELQTLVGAHLNDINAKFYLEMTDWNLQAAVCAYFDLQVFNKLPQMTFVKDITIGEGESVPPSTRFIKTWRIQNTGEDGWPGGCSLIFTGGEQMGAPSHVTVNSLAAGEVADISIEMVSPSQTGLYSSKWRMSTAQGNFFGGKLS
ncbi:protein ILRUN-like [Macrobrachium nipponense]|uniref:protein ILRUN-like n=1 Tax=Macrobrachium nipponense TaxID=159736 RepID=UPI0030C7A9F3